MIEPNIYCKVCGMAMECISRFYKENGRLPIVCEIGCADGQGTMRYGGFCDMIIAIDPMLSGRPDIFSKDEKDMKVDQDKLSIFKKRTSEFNVKLLIGCSLWPRILDEVKKILSGRTIDILIIDGCHHPMEAVYADFEKYYPFVSDNGYIIFDDTYDDDINNACQKALNNKDLYLEKVDEWEVNKPGVINQKCTALKKSNQWE